MTDKRQQSRMKPVISLAGPLFRGANALSLVVAQMSEQLGKDIHAAARVDQIFGSGF